MKSSSTFVVAAAPLWQIDLPGQIETFYRDWNNTVLSSTLAERCALQQSLSLDPEAAVSPDQELLAGAVCRIDHCFTGGPAGNGRAVSVFSRITSDLLITIGRELARSGRIIVASLVFPIHAHRVGVENLARHLPLERLVQALGLTVMGTYEDTWTESNGCWSIDRSWIAHAVTQTCMPVPAVAHRG